MSFLLIFEGELNGELATNCSVRFNLVTVKPLVGFLLLFAGFLFLRQGFYTWPSLT